MGIGGGSLILSTNKPNFSSSYLSKDYLQEGNSNGSSLLMTGGGGGEGTFSSNNSYIIGKKEANNSWEPGTAIDRPLNTKSTQIIWLPLDNQNYEGVTFTPPSLPTTISTSISNESHPSSSTLMNSTTDPSSIPTSSIPSTNPLPPPTAQTYLRISYACHSRQGRTPKPPFKPNQDSFISLSSLGNNPSLALFGVFDGHGPRGEEASQFARYNIPDATVRQTNFLQSPFDSFISSFEITHQRFTSPSTQQAGVDTAVSGTTAITILFNKDQYICANVGDSRAIIGSRNPQKGLVAKALSSDHKPQRPDERARIQRTNAKVLSENQLGIENGDPDKWYICRVHNGTIRYGVLFTRSLGDADAHTHLGLIATPEIRKGTIDPARDRFMVIASDGVWDYLGEDSVARIVAQATGMPLSTAAAGNEERLRNLDTQATDKAQTAVDALVNAANAKWEAEGDNRRDDITVIVLMFRTVTIDEMIQEQIERKLIPDPKSIVDNNNNDDGGGIPSNTLDNDEEEVEITIAEEDEEGAEETGTDDGPLSSNTSSFQASVTQNDTENGEGEAEDDDQDWTNREKLATTNTGSGSNPSSIILESNQAIRISEPSSPLFTSQPIMASIPSPPLIVDDSIRLTTESNEGNDDEEEAFDNDGDDDGEENNDDDDTLVNPPLTAAIVLDQQDELPVENTP